jgi:predicted ATP-grasp superfamily ATP-dependent carboligase
MENHPDLLEQIERRRPLRGCRPSVLREVREPGAMTKVARFPSLRHPIVRFVPMSHADEGEYLVKPRAGGGGAGIRVWSPGQPLGQREHLQQFIDGRAISAAYVAGERAVTLIGVSEQFIGEAAFGAKAFQYCGGVAPWPVKEWKTRVLMHLGVELGARFGLRGPFGVDLIQDESGELWAIEINPRFTASMELHERLHEGLSMLAAPPVAPATGGGHAAGKAILFAKADAAVPDLYDLFESHEVADVPEVGERVPQGRPICTVFADAATRDGCVARLHELARRLYTRLST